MKDLKIIYKDVEDLIPYVNNPRHNDGAVDAVASSIKNFGFKVPIVIDSDNEIITGHTRLKAAKKLGLEEVPCIVADDLTPEQVKAFRIADNKTSEFAEWDLELLEIELEGLDDIFTGFDDAEFDDIMGIDKEVEEDDFDEEPPENPISKRGDIWLLGKHRLMCGDSTKKEDVEKLMNGVKADMVFTDPPYGINIVGDNGKVGAENIAKNKVYSKVIADDTTEVAEKAYNIFKNVADGMMIWGGNYFVDFLEFSPSWLIWDKRLDMNSNNFADGEMVWCSFPTRVRIYKHLWNGMIQEGERETRVHPTQKPVKMLGNILKDQTQDGDLILDVFGGSGSTLIACEQLDRTCYMIELDPKYVDVIINRWEQYTGQKAVLISE